MKYGLEQEVTIRCKLCGHDFETPDRDRIRCDDCRHDKPYGHDIYDRGQYG